MEHFPKEIEEIIMRYKADMELLDRTPKDCITPLLMLPQLACNCDYMLLKMFNLARTSFPLIASILKFPRCYIDDYEEATRQRYARTTATISASESNWSVGEALPGNEVDHAASYVQTKGPGVN